jgi:hypothetical protein
MELNQKKASSISLMETQNGAESEKASSIILMETREEATLHNLSVIGRKKRLSVRSVHLYNGYYFESRKIRRLS